MLSIKEYKRLNRVFKKNGIYTILIKSIFTFPYNSDNLDVLVRRKDIKKVKNILKDEGYIELKNVEEPEKFLFRRFNGGKTVLPIHIHTVVGWGVPFLDNEFVWKNARYAEDCLECHIPSKEASFLITIAHEFYEDKFIKRKSIEEVKRLREDGINWDIILQQARAGGWLDGFEVIITLLSNFREKSGEFVKIPSEMTQKSNGFIAQKKINLITDRMTEKGIKIPFFYSKWFYYKKIFRDRSKPLYTKIFNVLTTLLWATELKVKQYLNYSSQRGSLVTISGIDGSGKTTQAAMLLEALKECEITTKYLWMRYGSSKSINKLIKIGKFVFRKKEYSQVNSKIEERRLYLDSNAKSRLWKAITILELFICSLKFRWYLFRGYFVIADRYILDAIAEMNSYIDDINYYAKILAFIFPKADVSFHLRVAFKDLLKRNSDEKELLQSPKKTKRFMNLYDFWAKRLEVKSLNGSINRKEINNNIIIEALNEYYSNFWTLYRWFLFDTPSQLNRNL